MTHGWQTKKLGDLCDVLDHKRKPITKRDRVAGDYPYFGATGVLGYVEGYLFDENLVLVGEDGAKWTSGENTAFAVEGKIWVNNHAHVLRPHRNKVLDNWLIYFLNHSDLSEFVSGLTVPKLNQGNLREIPIPLAPLPEQKRIADIVDEAFDRIATAKANAEKNLQNARALFESHLQSVFASSSGGWGERKLGEVSEVQSGGTPSVSRKEYWTGEIPWYSSGELNTLFTKDPERYLTTAGLDSSNAKLFPKGSLLIGMYDTAALKMSILDRDGAFNQAIAGVKPNDNIEIEFIFHAINAVKQRLLLERRGVRQKNLSLGKIKDIALPMPKRCEQRVVISDVKAVSIETKRLESIYQQKLAALEALKKSLLHQAFSGQL